MRLLYDYTIVCIIILLSHFHKHIQRNNFKMSLRLQALRSVRSESDQKASITIGGQANVDVNQFIYPSSITTEKSATEYQVWSSYSWPCLQHHEATEEEKRISELHQNMTIQNKCQIGSAVLCRKLETHQEP